MNDPEYVKLNPKHVVPTLVHDGRVLVESSLLIRYLDTLDTMERELAERPWLSGDAFGLADATVLPYVLRLEHLAMDPVLDASLRPRVADWLGRVKARPSYATAVEAWSAPAVVELLRRNGKAVWPEVEPLTRRSAAG